MNAIEIEKEMANAKKIMNCLLDCVKAGQKEYYKEHLQVSAYYLKLAQEKERLSKQPLD